jgi:hypothetical protein
MSTPEKKKQDINPATLTTPQKAATPSTHPICEDAPDLNKCEQFVERLSEASNNIDRRSASQ